jgi:Domain of unknown function (DUF222)
MRSWPAPSVRASPPRPPITTARRRCSPGCAGAAHRLVATGRALEHLPAVAVAFAAGRVTAEAVAVIAPVAREEHRAAAVAAGVDLAAVDAVLADAAATRPHHELAQVVHHYLARLDPDGTEPDPTEQRTLSMTRHADGRLSGRFELDAVGGEKVLAAVESIVQASRPAEDTRTRGQQQADALVQLADNALAAGTLPFLRTVKPHVVVTIGIGDLVDPHIGHGAARTGFGAIISAARPLAGLRRRHHPHRVRPGRAAGQPGPEFRPRRPSRSALNRRRRDIAGERCPALPTPPHQGSSRLPHRAATRRPMAHLSPRRHRDPHAGTTARSLTGSVGRGGSSSSSIHAVRMVGALEGALGKPDHDLRRARSRFGT